MPNSGVTENEGMPRYISVNHMHGTQQLTHQYSRCLTQYQGPKVPVESWNEEKTGVAFPEVLVEALNFGPLSLQGSYNT